MSIMRTQARLIRVKDPSLSPLEADLINFNQDNHQSVEAIAPIHIKRSEGQIPEAGERLVLRWEEGDQRLSGHASIEKVDYEAQQENQEWQTLKLTLKLQGIESNSRHYPRMLGGIALTFTPIDHVQEVEGWMGHQAELDLQHHPLDPLMNFSVNGLKFESDQELTESTLLACEVGLSVDQSRWRTLAKVVRVWNEETHFSIAIHFISPPTDLTDTLSAYTLRLQKAGM